ncbi:MAG: BolA family protein [Pseudomonadales bacterium]
MTNPGPVALRIESTLAEALPLAHLEVLNESAGHNVPPGSETHFKVVLVSDAFADVARIARHRQVNGLLAAELAGPVHALSVHAYTVAQWQERFANVPMSPPCLGGDGSLPGADGSRSSAS